MKVIASSLRKGNVIEREAKLYVIIAVEHTFPGKGMPVTQVDLRRIADGIKVSDRYRTTELVERAFVEDRVYTFLYSDSDGYHFMSPESYEQIAINADLVGEDSRYLIEGLEVTISFHESVPIALQLPQKVVLEVIETEPVIKGQTSSSSYKPALLSNQQRTMVPSHITQGSRVVILTEDGSYVSREKD